MFRFLRELCVQGNSGKVGVAFTGLEVEGVVGAGVVVTTMLSCITQKNSALLSHDSASNENLGGDKVNN